MRFIRRKNERAWLELVPKNESGRASRMAHLTGLDGLRPKRHLALLPYTAARAEFVQPARVGNPFNDGSRAFMAAGVDLKWGVTSNLTLDGTVNPGFRPGGSRPGRRQPHRSSRPSFPRSVRSSWKARRSSATSAQGGANNFWGFNTSDPEIFYSRRIGRTPQVSASGEFTDLPAATTILGAAKLTGKTRNGWSFGLLNAVTDRETARTQSQAIRGVATVEPLTNYLVMRMQRDIRPPRRRRLPRDCRARGGWTRRRCSPASPRTPIVLGGDALLVPRRRSRMGGHREDGRELDSRHDHHDHARAARGPALFSAARRAARDARSDADLARRLQRPDQPQPQQRPAARQRRVLGRQPGLRVERPRLSQHRRSLRRPRRRDVARRDAGQDRARVECVGGEVVDLQFQSRACRATA